MWAVVESRSAGKWSHTALPDAFESDYGAMGFLADVRNYGESESLAPSRGAPASMDVNSMLALILQTTCCSDFDQAQKAKRDAPCKRNLEFAAKGNGYRCANSGILHAFLLRSDLGIFD
jgi:hypothetical protein